MLEGLTTDSSHVNRHGATLLEYTNDVGQLVVLHAMELLHVRIDETQEHAGDSEIPEDKEPPLRLDTSFHRRPNGLITPLPLYTGGNFSVSLRDPGQRASGRYVPYAWPDGGTSLRFEQFGDLSPNAMARVRFIASFMTNAASDFVQSGGHKGLRLVEA